jgi:hypothetical protein
MRGKMKSITCVGVAGVICVFAQMFGVGYGSAVRARDFVAQIRLVDSKKITSDSQETVLLESRSLSNLLHSPVATLQVPAHWKRKVEYEPVDNDEVFAQGIDGNLFKVSFENTAPKSYEREFVYCSPSFPNDALLELCKRGPPSDLLQQMAGRT